MRNQRPRAQGSTTIAVVVGTRPEVVKMSPVYRALSGAGLEPVLVSTGQHIDLLRGAFAALDLAPDHELAIMTDAQTPSSVAARILDRLPTVLESIDPAAVLVQGDTTTAFATALAAYHLQIPVGHVEAGLRTYDDGNPFPEEANRQLIGRLAHWSFAPTELARANLLAERIAPERIHVTGNTAVDALHWVLSRTPRLADAPPHVLVTLHRRESFGEPLDEILGALAEFLATEPAAQVIWPVHPNPRVRAAATARLGSHPRVHLTHPMPYDVFAAHLARARVVLSDSGGVQEEAPSLGVRVLVARDTTERPESVRAGHNRLVGRARREIVAALVEAWHAPAYRGPLPAPNPYGDGQAGVRIAAILAGALGSELSRSTRRRDA